VNDNKKEEQEKLYLLEKLIRLEATTINLEKDLVDLKAKFLDYVTKHEFTPVKLVVFGLVGTILTSALVLIITRLLVPISTVIAV